MELRVQFTKRPDGNVILRCTRKDGSVTWQRYDKQAAFFSHHDLYHYAVETILELRQVFYGLIADGWDIADMDGKGPRGKAPYDAGIAEYVVGLLTQERVGLAKQLSAAEFNAQLDQMIGQPAKHPLSDVELGAVRNRVSSLFREWAATPPGGMLELSFDRSPHAFVESEHAF